MDDADCPGGVCDPAGPMCVECMDDADCPGGVCDPAGPACVPCLDDADCPGGVCDPAGPACVPCLDDADCAVGVCDPAGPACVECVVDADCFAALICGVAQTCVECVDGGDCASGICNPDGTCEPPPPVPNCTGLPNQCAWGVDGGVAWCESWAAVGRTTCTDYCASFGRVCIDGFRDFNIWCHKLGSVGCNDDAIHQTCRCSG